MIRGFKENKCFQEVVSKEEFNTEIEKIKKKEATLLKNEGLTTVDQIVSTDTLDFTLYDKIVVIVGGDDELAGDSVILEIASDGTFVNNMAHFYSFAGTEYNAFGYVYIQDNKVNVQLKGLTGWTETLCQIKGILK